MLVFGWRTAILGLVSVQVLLLAAALLRAPRNLAANRILAGLLVVVVGLLTPFTIGFAGFYDAWPWLSFAPFAIPLAVGPLAWAYTVALTTGRAPARLRLHLAPALVQFAYQSVCFALPLAAKDFWNDRVHEPFVDPLVSAATLIGMAAYCVAGLRRLGRHRAGLSAVVSDEHRYAAGWLGRYLAATVLALAVWGGFQGWEIAFGRLSYFNLMGLYLVLAGLALYLAIEGWRHADLVFPATARAEAPGPAGRDWRLFGERWAERTRREGWWREPDLDLADLAARLGTNTTYLSRALNEGLGVNFAGFVNGLRARAVAEALVEGAPADLLSVAFDAGFSSKASFNRAFKAEFGMSPSAWRRANGSNPQTSPESPISRRAAG